MTTTWGYRFECPDCGFASVTQDERLRDALIDWHEADEHDGRRVCEWSEEADIPIDEFPEDEDPEGPAAVTTTDRALEVSGHE